MENINAEMSSNGVLIKEKQLEPIDMWISIIAASIPVLFFIRKYFQGNQFQKKIPLNGWTAIVTGCNSGIGKETIYELAKRGAKIYMGCRDFKKAERLRLEIIRLTGNYNIINNHLDLASFESIRGFVKKFIENEDHLNCLINNAGIVGQTTRQLTNDGLEMTIGINHFGHFLLTNLLLDILKATKPMPTRIINVSSDVHKWAKMNIHNLNSEKSYEKWSAYRQSKLANILFTRELSKRLMGTGVTANSLHPGAVNTQLIRNQSIFTKFIFYIIYIFLKTPKSGAQTTLSVALDPRWDKTTGKYFNNFKIVKESIAAKDDIIAEWLWAVSEKVTNLGM